MSVSDERVTCRASTSMGMGTVHMVWRRNHHQKLYEDEAGISPWVGVPSSKCDTPILLLVPKTAGVRGPLNILCFRLRLGVKLKDIHICSVPHPWNDWQGNFPALFSADLYHRSRWRNASTCTFRGVLSSRVWQVCNHAPTGYNTSVVHPLGFPLGF